MASKATDEGKRYCINGYLITQPFRMTGTAEWTIAEREGKTSFLKRFNTPKRNGFCDELCDRFEERKKRLYRVLREINKGNLVSATDFFCDEQIYYIATEYIPEDSVTGEKVSTLAEDKRNVIINVLLYCMISLQEAGIVHADLKPTNVRLKSTMNGFYALKLIDFDSSYFTDDPPEEREDLEGDPAYMAPEVLQNICGEFVPLTTGIDVFAVGIMLHEFLTGSMPGFDTDSYDYLCEAVADGTEPVLSDELEESRRVIIQRMLSREAEDRPTFREVFEVFRPVRTVEEHESPCTRPECERTLTAGRRVPSHMKRSGDFF